MIERRHFLKALGLTGSAVALGHCSPTPSDVLIPYLIPADAVTPGVPTYYATTCRMCPAGCGMLVKTINGRAIKAEGNPNHPVSRGHLCARGQASLQSLYNPDRHGMPLRRASDGTFQPLSWDDAEEVLATRLREARSRGTRRVAWLGGVTTGALRTLTQQWLRGLNSDRYLLYEPFDAGPVRQASETAFGRSEVPRYDLDRAEYVLAFGAEFLDTWLSNVEFTSAYAALRARHVDDGQPVFTWVSPRLSLTGLNSDAWIPVRPGTEAVVALAIAQAIVDAGLVHPSAAPHLPWLTRALAPYRADDVASELGTDAAAIRAVAREFVSPQPSLALGGGVSGAGEQHAVTLELAVLLLNVLAGNVGVTVRYGAGSALDALATRGQLASLSHAMAAGEIDVLLVHDTNPAFSLPSSDPFHDAIRHVPFIVSFANTPDETSALAHLVLPDLHFLESWGDYMPRAGVDNLLQPVTAPLTHARATADVLLAVARHLDQTAFADTPAWPDWLRRERSLSRADRQAPQAPWVDALGQGGSFDEPATADVHLLDVSASLSRIIAQASGGVLTLIAFPSPHLYDGRTAGEPWLQEVPDAVTKIAWGSWIEVHPETAARLGLREGARVRLESPYGGIETQCHVWTGIQPDVIAMPVGFGRTSTLRFAAAQGANVLTLLPPHARDSAHAAWHVADVRVTKMSGNPQLIMMQAADTALPGDTARSHPTLYPPHEHREHRWGMAIDLNACTGCNACVVACYAENNLPIVGPEACRQGHEMAWIRIERHAHPEPGGQSALRRTHHEFLPMLCQQCDQAPCESVCPVNATYHNPEGLSAQVYNRCIGTRFCSNNCPYKVRRFNFTQPAWAAPLNEQLNPDVTVRSVGVMEKCTFCVQRIQAGKNAARRDRRPLHDGDIVPACAQTCPADAIIFGDLLDPASRVSRASAGSRGYTVLEELNTRPAITYLHRRIRGEHDNA